MYGRNIIKLAGGPYARLKGLSGDKALQNREVVITTDTKELYVGADDGSFHLLGNTIIGDKLENIQNIEPQKGRYFFNAEKNNLYVSNGSGWKLVGVSYDKLRGLGIEESTGELYIRVDNKFIVFDNEGQLTLGNTDYGVF